MDFIVDLFLEIFKLTTESGHLAKFQVPDPFYNFLRLLYVYLDTKGTSSILKHLEAMKKEIV